MPTLTETLIWTPGSRAHIVTAGMHGYSHMTGGWEGGQAEYVRVAFADVNLLKLPNEGPDEKYVLLSVRCRGALP